MLANWGEKNIIIIIIIIGWRWGQRLMSQKKNDEEQGSEKSTEQH
jgi:hypothetical protein